MTCAGATDLIASANRLNNANLRMGVVESEEVDTNMDTVTDTRPDLGVCARRVRQSAGSMRGSSTRHIVTARHRRFGSVTLTVNSPHAQHGAHGHRLQAINEGTSSHFILKGSHFIRCTVLVRPATAHRTVQGGI